MARSTITVPGHALQGDARPYTPAREEVHPGKGTAGIGHALCECGWLSDELPTGNKRRDAHRAHRQDALDSQELLEPTPAPTPTPKKAKRSKRDQEPVRNDASACPHTHRSERAAAECAAYIAKKGRAYGRPAYIAKKGRAYGRPAKDGK